MSSVYGILGSGNKGFRIFPLMVTVTVHISFLPHFLTQMTIHFELPNTCVIFCSD